MPLGKPLLDSVDRMGYGGLLLSRCAWAGPRMAVSFGIELHHRFMDGAVEVLRSGEGLVSEVMPLQVAPDPFDVVELGSVFRQPLDPEPVGARREGGPDRLAGVDRAVIQDKHDGLEHYSELGPIAPIDLLQESKEVCASLGSTGAHDEFAMRPVQHAEQRHFGALARRWNA